MDHIVANKQYIVPYIASPPYDEKDFFSFPARAGWKLESTGSWRPMIIRFSQQVLEAFLQSWLFFGVLREVLGVPIAVEDFLVEVSLGSYHITTTRLGTYIDNWKSRMRESGYKAIRELIHAQMILDEAHLLVSKYCTITKPGEKPVWQILPSLALSFSVLGETLSHARANITSASKIKIELTGWLEHAHLGWGYNATLLKDMLTYGWCPYMIDNLLETLQQSTCGLLYAQYLSHPVQLRLDHKKCSRDLCVARQTGFHNICQLTQDPPCQCSYVPVDFARLIKILETGGIPILRYEHSKQVVDVEEYHSGLSYAIISHVFADGFANTLHNSVRLCHLIKIREILKKLSTKNQLMTFTDSGDMNVPVYFWFDALAIPLGDAHVELRQRTVKYMHEMYSNASCTIVLDMGLMVQSRGRDYSDAAMRITTSYWMTRLWTLQEAYLSQRVYFIFKDAIVDMDELEATFPKNSMSPVPWAARRYWYALLGPERSMLRHNPGRSLLKGPQFLTSLWNALALRKTAIPHHEPLAIATLLGLDINDFGNVQFNPVGPNSSGDSTLENKMRQLLDLIAKVSNTAIPAGLAFVARPKLSENGFSWAPASWLKLSQTRHQYLTEPQKGAKLTAYGLDVELPGFILHNMVTNQPYEEKFEKFAFPCDRTLRNWLTVRVDARTVQSAQHELAIVAEHIPISPYWQRALLVQTSRTVKQPIDCQIICTADIKVVLSEAEISELTICWRARQGMTLMGELKPSNTMWCIDGVHVEMASNKVYDSFRYISNLSSRLIYNRKLE